MTLVQGSFSGVSPPIHPGHPWGQRSSQQTSSFPRGNWWPYPPNSPVFVLWPHTSRSRTMSDEIFRLLPILISTMSHYKLLHSENGNRLRRVGWRDWPRGGGSGGVCIDKQSPKKNTWGKERLGRSRQGITSQWTYWSDLQNLQSNAKQMAWAWTGT